ncbi:ABC transporter ATP-binding protein [Sulfurospirillum sp. 1307]
MTYTENVGSHIDIISLSKSFCGKQVISDINFTIKKGSFTVLLGPSGCGKSTMLRMIAGLEEPDSGKILLKGEDIVHKSPSQRSLSMVFQSYALFPHLSIRENIIFGLKIRKVKKHLREDKLAKVAKLVGLQNMLDKKPGQLSGGQKQRVALARAFVADHPLCLMDEPLSNLDAKLRHEMRIEIRSLQKMLGMTVLYVTHDQTEAMSMADHIILLNNGKIEQQGTPWSLYQKVATTFVGRFIGTPPMNILKLHKTKKELFINNKSIKIDSLNSFLDGEFFLGIRPEDVKVDNNQEGIEGTVLFQDYHGSNTILGIELDKQSKEKPFLVQISGQKQYSVGEQVEVAWEEENINIFDSLGKRVEI